MAIINGTTSANLLNGTDENDTILADGGNDTVYGGNGHDTIDGGKSADILYGNNDNDSIGGGDGNDTLLGGAGNNMLAGGSGDDRFVVEIAAGAQDIVTDFKARYANEVIDLSVFTDIEHFEELLTRMTEVSRIVGTETIVDCVIDLGNGQTVTLQNVIKEVLTPNDFQGSASISSYSIIEGSSTADTIVGNVGDDSIVGGSGDDAIEGIQGHDLIFGDNGNDTLLGGAGNDHLYGLSDSDLLHGGADQDTLDGGKANDTLDGGLGNDVLTGGDGYDSFIIGLDTGSVDTITDFKPQYADEKLDFTAFSSLYSIEEVLALATQEGSDTVFHLGTNQILILNNVLATALHQANITGLTASVPVNIIQGTTGDDTLTGTAGKDSILGAQGGDILSGANGDDSIYGEKGNDLLHGNGGNDLINGGEDLDYLFGDEGNDTLLGEKGNDRLLGDSGNDTISAGDGNDVAEGGSGADSIGGDSNNDFLSGGAGNDTLDGGKGNDTVYGGAGHDSISGYDGNDELYADSGNDTLTGGSGDDSFVIGVAADKADVITDFKVSSLYEKIDLSAFTSISDFDALMALATDTANGVVLQLGNNQTVTLTGVLRSELQTTDFIGNASHAYSNPNNDIFTGTGSSDHFSGADGDDLFTFTTATLISGDTVSGGTGTDTIEIIGSGTVTVGTAIFANKTGIETLALKGEATYSVFVPNAVVTASDEDCLTVDASAVQTVGVTINAASVLTATNHVSMIGGQANDTVSGGRGDDTLLGRSGNDVIFGDRGNDVIEGDLGNDTLLGGDGNDTVRGYEGDDSLRGSNGDDRLDGGLGNDTLDGGTGKDTLRGGLGNDSLKAGSDDDYVHAGDGNDYLSGYNGNDYLMGESGNDVLKGEEGNDTLDGGRDNDTLTGGNGNDTFFIQHYSGTTSGVDAITDFDVNSDKIDLSLFTPLTHFTDLAGRITQSGSNQVLTLSDTQTVILQNVTGTLTAANFSGLDQSTYNVHDFGALGNGVVDDRSAIQDAIDAASANGGGVVYLPGGEYCVTGTGDAADGAIMLYNNVTLKGDGMGLTTIKVQDGYADKITGIVRTPSGIENHHITVMDITIDGNRQTADNPDGATGNIDGFFCGVTPDSTLQDKDITLLRVEVANNSGYGFDPHEQTLRLSVIDSKSHHNGKDGFVSDYQIDAVYEGNESWANDRHGFNVVTSSHDVVFKDNIAYDNGSSGLTIQRGYADIDWPRDISVIGGEYYGNALSGILLNMSNHITVTGVDIHDNQRYGIDIQGAIWTTVDGNTIHNNSQSKSNTYDEITLRQESDTITPDGGTNNQYGAEHNLIINNIIYSDAAIASRYGVREEADLSDYNTILNNSISGPLSGTILANGAHTVIPDAANFIKGTFSADSLFGDDAANIMSGSDGNDTLTGGLGNDTLQGGNGSDSLLGGTDNDTLEGNSGNDILAGGDGNDLLSGGDDVDMLKGENGDDTLVGGAGLDVLTGGEGIDSLFGGDGNDVLLGQNGDDLLSGGNQNDSLSGGAGMDILFGDTGNDALNGNENDDLLYGGEGADTLIGSAGADTLSGNGGADYFCFTAISDSTAANVDLITDFVHGEDKINFLGLGVSVFTSSFDGTHTVVGIAAIGLMVNLSGNVTLTASDFIFR